MIEGVVYKLFCKDLDGFYIGSSMNFHNRQQKHKYSWNDEKSKEYNKKLYKYIRDNGGFDEWNFEILEMGEYEDKYCMKDRERYFIETLIPTLNCAIPNRTNEEWREDNKDKVYNYKKKYADNNKKLISNRRKINVLCNVCNCEVRKSGLPRHNRSLKHLNNI